MTVGTMRNFSQVSGPDMEKIVPDDRDDELIFISQVRNDRGDDAKFFPSQRSGHRKNRSWWPWWWINFHFPSQKWPWPAAIFFSQVRNDRGRPRFFFPKSEMTVMMNYFSFPKSEMTVAGREFFSQVRNDRGHDAKFFPSQKWLWSIIFPKSEMTVVDNFSQVKIQNQTLGKWNFFFLFWFRHAHQVPNTPWPSAKTQVKTSVFAILLSVN